MPNQVSSTSQKTLVFLDASLSDISTLMAGFDPNAEVILLDPTLNGIRQITQALAGRSNIDSLQIYSHGDAGSLLLGNTLLNETTLDQYRTSLEGWRQALSTNSDILLYGCHTGAGEIGLSFLRKLSQFTGADVAASSDLTGFGGNWQLEVQVGAIETQSVLNATVAQSYQGTLNVITVTSTADSGAGSLRDALARATAGSTIVVASTLANRTIRLTSGQLVITKNLTIDATAAPGLTLSGNNTSRIMRVERNISVTLKNLTFVDGNAVSGATPGWGGAINVGNFAQLNLFGCTFRNNKGDIGGAVQVGYGTQTTVENCTFDGNDGSRINNGFSAGAIATAGGGGAGGPGFLIVRNSRFTNNKGFNGGAIYNLLQPVTIENCTFLNNTATGNGGGAIFSDGANPIGPQATVGGTFAIRNSWFEGNQARGEGGALFLWSYKDRIILENSTVIRNSVTLSDKNLARGGGLTTNGELTLRNVTFANNVAQTQGGGLWLFGNSPMNITNSTFSGNRVTNDAGGAMFINTAGGTPVNIINTTIVHNSAGRANGALWMNNNNKDSVLLRNSIVAFNTATDRNQNQVGFPPRDGGGNIEFPGPVGVGQRVAATSQVVDPMLGPLTNVGGTLIHPLLAGSPAINTGVSQGAPTTDQRNFRRDTRIDIGAVEFGGFSMTGGSGNDVLLGNSSANTLTGGGGDDVLIGIDNGDTLTGGTGADRFVYTTRTQDNAVARFSPTMLDRITDFRVSEGDRIQLDTDKNLLTSERPSRLFHAGTVAGSTLEAAIQAAFLDKNQTISGAQALAANEAVFFRWGSRSFIAVNDATATFGSNDLILEVTGIQMPSADSSAGTLSVANYFV